MKSKILTIGIILILILALSGCIETVANGRHSGQITAVEQNVIIWKTWSVYVKTDISSSQEDMYCVENATLIPQLNKLSEDRSKVTVLYRDEMIVAPWRCGSNRIGIITGIEEIK